MEIDIPDLDDVKFEEFCFHYGPSLPNCISCHGTGYRLTTVGARLIEFLEVRGIKLHPREKDDPQV